MSSTTPNCSRSWDAPADVVRDGLSVLISRAIADGNIDPGLGPTETAAWLQAIVDATYLNARAGHSPHAELRRTAIGCLIPSEQPPGGTSWLNIR